MSRIFDRIRERFYIPPGILYFDGNSLGPLCTDAEDAVLRTLDEWKRLGIRGWLEADPPWFTLCEELAARIAGILGASPDCVAVTGSTTTNLHALVATLYEPTGRRSRILADPLNFPTDLYALRAQVALRGGDPERDLVLVPSSDGRTVSEDAIIAAMDETFSLALLPSVLYRSGQLLDVARIARAASDRGILLGLDLSHSIGVIPHDLDAWGVDFAVWCHYKYLNAGPGALGGLYRSRRHAERTPALPGWWGVRKEAQFGLSPRYEPADTAGAFQVGTPSILGVAALGGALKPVEEVGIHALRQRSIELTERLIDRCDAFLPEASTGFRIGSPREPGRRGGHVALEHPSLAAAVAAALRSLGVIPDFRPPDVIRLCPAPLYTRLEDVDAVVERIREVTDCRLYERVVNPRGLVT
jgi:kynureninase